MSCFHFLTLLRGQLDIMSYVICRSVYYLLCMGWQARQGGLVGISLDCEWGEPMTNSEADRDAAQRHVLFQLGW